MEYLEFGNFSTVVYEILSDYFPFNFGTIDSLQ